MTMWGNYGLQGIEGSLQQRTKRAWLFWARWDRGTMLAFQHQGAEPATVPEVGALCPICFGGSIYVRLGMKNIWMSGIAVCHCCHAPVMIVAQEPQREAESVVIEQHLTPEQLEALKEHLAKT